MTISALPEVPSPTLLPALATITSATTASPTGRTQRRCSCTAAVSPPTGGRPRPTRAPMIRARRRGNVIPCSPPPRSPRWRLTRPSCSPPGTSEPPSRTRPTVQTLSLTTVRRPTGTALPAAAYVASWVVGLLLAPTSPSHDAPAAAVAGFYAAHGGAVVSSALLVHGTAGLALAALAVGVARVTGVRGGLRRVVIGTGLAAALLSGLQFILAVVAGGGAHAATTSRTLLLAIDFLDVLKIALLASFASVATTAAARGGAAPGWLRLMTALLVPLLLIGSAALVGVDALLPVLEVSLLMLLAWAAAIGVLLSRTAWTA